jgi:hypothetical protein
VKFKEGGKVDLKIIVTHSLGDGLRSIIEWKKLPMIPCKAFFLQVQPNFVSHMKLMWHLVLIMALIVLVIGLLKNIWNLLVDVLDRSINQVDFLSSFRACNDSA